VTERFGRRDLFRLRRPSAVVPEPSPAPNVAKASPAVAKASPATDGFSLEGFYARREPPTNTALPPFSLSARLTVDGSPIAPVATTARGTPELAAYAPPPWAASSAPALAAGLVPRVRETTCLAFRSVCTVCIERCPEPGAIVVSLGRPTVVAERCTGCGACVGACPAPINGFEIVPRSTTRA
jgi:ferredoxin